MRTLILFLFLVGFTSNAQDAPTNSDLSKAEEFSSKSGRLIQKQYLELDKIKGIEIKVVKYSDLISEENVTAVHFSKVVATQYTSDTKIARLDADEIDGLIKSIQKIEVEVFPRNPTVYTEVLYKSRSGFEAGCFYSKEEWRAYLKLERFDEKSIFFIGQEDLSQIKQVLERAKPLL